MNNSNFTTTLTVQQSAQAVFDAITNVRGWWSEEIEGPTAQQGDVFSYRFEDVHTCTIRLTEVIPAKKVEWLVEENYFKFTENPNEWKGDKMIFDISEKDGMATLVFTQVGLQPDVECFEICRDSWTNYIQHSLKNLILTGKGSPNGKGTPRTKNEEKFLSEG